MNGIIIYQTNDNKTQVEVRFDGNTVFCSVEEIYLYPSIEK